VNDFNIEGRYPDFKYVFYKKATKEFAEKYLTRMKEFYECTRRLI
ncbi:MAG: HEPN domain-containing protein, partial [Ignavibacteriae bacterium]|nr:HEPN domain-containing protein [Ignavibacteriota bacterium]